MNHPTIVRELKAVRIGEKILCILCAGEFRVAEPAPAVIYMNDSWNNFPIGRACEKCFRGYGLDDWSY